MKEGDGTTALTFWDHLDELRGCLVRTHYRRFHAPLSPPCDNNHTGGCGCNYTNIGYFHAFTGSIAHVAAL